MPFDVVEKLLPENRDSCVIAGEKEQRTMQPFISHRELSSDNPMMLFAFRRKRLPVAVLVVSDTPFLEAAPSVLRVIMSAISDSAATLLDEHRGKQLSAVRHRAVFTAAELSENPHEILAGQKQPLVALLIDASALLRSLMERYSEADRFRVKQDLIRIVSAVVAEIGVVVDLAEDSLVVFLSDASKLDGELLGYHIAAAVRHVFLDAESELLVESREQGQESADEFARAFL